MKTKICGITFRRINDCTIEISSGNFCTKVYAYTPDERTFLEFANDYFMFCY